MADPNPTPLERSQLLYRLQNNFTTLFDLKSQLVHTALFVIAAIMTVGFYAIEDSSYKQENKVVLTNLRELSISDFKTKPPIDTKSDLMNKWLCPPPPPTTALALMLPPLNETWGPDNVCPCFRSKNCTSATQCADLEKTCYKKTVPQYAHVYAGVETPYYSIIAGFLLIHISVLLNMTIEVMDDPQQRQADNGIYPIQDTPEDAREQEHTPMLRVDPDESAYDGSTGRGSGSRFTYYGAPGSGQGGATVLEIYRKQTDQRPAHGMLMLADALKNKAARFGVLTLLSVAVGIVTTYGYLEKTSARGKDQKCDGDNMCMTETLVFVVVVCVSVCCTFLLGWSALHYLTTKGNRNATGAQMVRLTASMLEEVTLTTACMALVASFTAMSGVHDDTTILFDVIAVLFIGFVQSLQHKVMLMRETVIEHCEKSDTVCTDGLGKQHTLSSEVLGYFLHTRLFIFVVIVTSVYVFFERIQPTLPTMDAASTWNSYMRNVVLLVSVLPNMLCDVSYEFFHMRKLQIHGEHMTYTGAAMWRRTVYLLYMIIFLFAERFTYKDRPLDSQLM